MYFDFGLIGNGETLAKVRVDGALTEAFYPSVGFFRHIIQSQFGVYLTAPGECHWLHPAHFEVKQDYLSDTNVLRTTFRRPGLFARVVDYVHPETSGIIRTLEVRNDGAQPLDLALFHTEAASVSDHRGEFGYNVVYYDRLHQHMVRYRGHPWNNAVEAQVVWLVGGSPAPEEWQCGVSYKETGPEQDGFQDVRDGALQGNRYAFGDPTGVTSAFLWNRRLAPGQVETVSIYMVPGMSLFEAEDALDSLEGRQHERLLSETVSYWRGWIEPGRKSLPMLPERRLETLYLRSLLLLKLMQDRRRGSFIAAPTLEPDYRYCWPRDGVFEAWALDLCGYHEEARLFYQWCRRTQMYEGFWYQNHYTDGRRHWTSIQVDQGASVVWGAWEHYRSSRDRSFLVEMWPMVSRAVQYVLSRRRENGLVYSEQDLWEETAGQFAYTNAACAAGLQAGVAIAREVGREGTADNWAAEAEKLGEAIRQRLLENGAFIGSAEPDISTELRSDYRFDISILGLAEPFRVVAAQSPEMLRTARALEEEMRYQVGGIGRYRSDRFMDGNPWSLCAIWMALFYLEAGRVQEADRYLHWCLKHAMHHDLLPEQSHKHHGAPTSAAPLGWSHAWMIVLLQRLGGLAGSPGSVIC